MLDKYDISHHTILSIFEDKDKNIWLGTSGDGIFMIGNEERKFTTIQTKFFLRSAERYLSYHGLCNDADGNIWAGTDGEGIFKFNTKGEILRQYNTKDKTSGLATDVFISAYRDHYDNLWFGSYSDGLYSYDKQRGSFIHYTHAPTDSLYHWEIRSALFMKTPRATSGSGLHAEVYAWWIKSRKIYGNRREARC